jgi:MFS family permease
MSARLVRALRPDYGWVIIGLAALAMVATLPGRTHGLGMVTERLLADPAFPIDRVTYSNINLWTTLLGALFCLPCGSLIDRYGLRVTLTATVAALGLVVLAMTQFTGYWSLFLLILLTRGFGQSALSVISIAMVAKWYRGRLGMPMAIYSLLLSLGFAAAAQLAKPYAEADWRVVWGGMGWLLLAGMAPLALLLTREPPQDEEDEAAADGTDCCSGPAGGYTLGQALQTPAFWVFGLAISLVALIVSGLSLFNESVLKEQGFAAQVYYDVLTVTAAVGLFAKLPVGWLMQRVSLSRMWAVALAIKAGCLLWLPHVHTRAEVAAYAVGMGITGTITTVLFFAFWGQAYGRAHLGRIQAAAQMLTVFASALGPRLLAESFDRNGSYAPIFNVLAGTAVALAVCAWVVRVPRPEDAPQPQPTEPILSPQGSQL